MKNKFGVFLTYFFEIMLIVGCSQTQPTMTATAIPKQTNTPLPVATLTPLPTFIPLPTLTPFPTIPPPPLPKGIFEPFQESIYESAPLPMRNERIKTAFGVIPPKAMIEENILVDSAMSYTVFSLFWEGGDLDLTLIQPDGKEINPSMTTPAQDFVSYLLTNDLSFISDPGSERYYFILPYPGKWTMRIFGKSTPAQGSNYMIQVTSNLATGFRENYFDKNDYVSGSPIKFSLGITDSTSGSLLAPPGYIHGASIHVTAETPNKELYTFELYDDGLHNDGQADDGIYGNTFNNTLVTGKYNFYIQVSGINNRAKEPFTREYYLSTTVK
jgi:hypothetical protein